MMTPKERVAMQQALEALEAEQEQDRLKAYRDGYEQGRFDAGIKQAEQEPFDMNDHPPHRLCECRKCMEYFTPLPGCDAFAASGKPIKQEPVAYVYEKHIDGFGTRKDVAFLKRVDVGTKLYAAPQPDYKALWEQMCKRCDELDSELAKYTEQEPVAYVYEKDVAGIGMRKDVAFTKHVEVGTDLYAAPVRTKDLTDDEIDQIRIKSGKEKISLVYFARAVIAADREKNK